jgi:hypothetical protein
MDYCDSARVAEFEHLKTTMTRMLKTVLFHAPYPQARREALFPGLRSRLGKILNAFRGYACGVLSAAAFLGNGHVLVRLGQRV